MQPCLNLATVLRADLEEAVDAAARAGFETVELWVDSLERYLDTHQTEDLCRLLDSHRMHVISIGDIESITFCNQEQFDDVRRRCERLAAVARAIACPTLVVSASVRPRGIEESQVASDISSVLGKLLDIAEPEGVGLALAFRSFNWCAINTLEQALKAVTSHAGRQIGLVLDTFDLHATGVQAETLRSIDIARISVMRLSDCLSVPAAILSETDRALPGEGVVDLDGMLSTLSEGGYKRPVSLKILNPKLWGLNAEEVARVVMAITEKYLPGMCSEEAHKK